MKRRTGWFRARKYYPLHGGRRGARVDPWVYFEWKPPFPVSQLDTFARAVFSSYRDVEFLGEEPPNISATQFQQSMGVSLYLERF